MTKMGQKVLAEALQPEVAERAELAAELLASLDGEPDADVEAAWAAEIERRAARARSSEDVGRSWAEARDSAKDALSNALTLPIRISEEADAEMAEAARWYEMHRAGFGREFLDCVDTAVARIAETPRLGSLVPAAETEEPRPPDPEGL